MKTKSTLVIMALLATLGFAGTGHAQNIVQNNSLAVAGIEIKEPKAGNNQQFKDVLIRIDQIGQGFRGIGADTIRLHPSGSRGCLDSGCHVNDKIADKHRNWPAITMDFDSPAASCQTGGCHSGSGGLEKAAKMPFYAKAYINIDNPENLGNAKSMLDAASWLRAHLATELVGLPEFKEVKVVSELAGRGIQKSLTPQRFIHARPTDLIPAAALNYPGLLEEVLAMPAQVTDPTKLEVKLEARTQRARGLASHLELLETLEDILDEEATVVVTEVDIRDRYRPPMPLDASLALVQAGVLADFSEVELVQDDLEMSQEYRPDLPLDPTLINIEQWASANLPAAEMDRNELDINYEFDAPGIELEPTLGQLQAWIATNLPEATVHREQQQSGGRFNYEWRSGSNPRADVKFERGSNARTKLEFKKLDPSLKDSALTFIASVQSANSLVPVRKAEVGRKVRWTVPGNSDLRVEFESKTGDKTKIEFKKFDPTLKSAALSLLADIRNANPGANLHKSEIEQKIRWEAPATVSPRTRIDFEKKSGNETKIEFRRMAPAKETAALAILDAVQAIDPANVVERRIEREFQEKDAVVTELEVKDEYKPPLLLETSLPLLEAWVAENFHEDAELVASIKKDEVKSNEWKVEWELNNALGTEIKFQWKDNDKTKIEFKRLDPDLEALAFEILDFIRDAHPVANLDKREVKEKFGDPGSLLKEIKIELKYKPHALPPAALQLLMQQVDLLIPDAILKRNETHRIEWEIPGSPKGEIKAEIKDGESKIETKIEFKKVGPSLHEDAILILARVQEAYPDIDNEFSKYEFKFEARSAQEKAELMAGLDRIQRASANGDFKFEVKHKEDRRGTVPTSTELWDLALGYAGISGDALRRLRNEIKLEKNLKFKEVKTEVVSAAPLGADVNRDGVVDIEDFNLVRSLLREPASVLPEADLNYNGVIDIGDLRAIINAYECPRGICE